MNSIKESYLLRHVCIIFFKQIRYGFSKDYIVFATGNRFYLDHLKKNEIYVKIYEDIYYTTTWTYVFVESCYCYSL